MSPATVSIHILSPDVRSVEDDALVLTDSERTRASQFHFREHAAYWMAFRAGLRRILGNAIQASPREVPLVVTEFGKPVLAPPFNHLHFSLSHCNDLALVALCEEGPIGCDLEPVSRAPDLLDCESTICHPTEIATLPVERETRGLRLLEIWTAKEALLKALGTGLSHPPETVRILTGADFSTATSDTPLSGIQNQIIRRLVHPLLTAYRSSLSAPSSVTRLEFIPPEGSTLDEHAVIAIPCSAKSDG